MTDRDWRPRYLQLAEELRAQIERGDIKPGEPLPSEADLAASSRLSRTSVRNSIRQLREWGLIRAEQGRGTYVRGPKARVRRNSPERYQWEKERALLSEEERRKTGGTEMDTGLTTDGLQFHCEYHVIDADAELADEFHLDEGSRLLQRDYWTTSRHESAALSMSRSWLVYDIVAANPDLLDAANEPWPGGLHHQLSTVGVEIDRVRDRITARPPLPREADILGLEGGTAVLVLRKTSWDTAGRIVEVADAVYAGDRTELVYDTQLSRWTK